MSTRDLYNLPSQSGSHENEQASLIESRSLSEQVVELLYRQIINGTLQAGQHVNEAVLARQLGISRNPIREAVRRLQERGLLVMVPRKGTFVRRMEIDDVNDTFRFRLVIESHAIELALPVMTDADLDELQGIVDSMVEAADRGNAIDLVERDVFFHRRICELSGSKHVVRAFMDLYAEVRMLIALVEKHFESMHAAAVDHYPVVAALRTRDTATAIAAITEHIKDPWQRILANQPLDGAKP